MSGLAVFSLLMQRGFPGCFRFHQYCLQLHFLEKFSQFQVGAFLKIEGKNFEVEVCTSRQEKTTFLACIKYNYIFNFNLYLYIEMIPVSIYSFKLERQNMQKTDLFYILVFQSCSNETQWSLKSKTYSWKRTKKTVQ